MAGATVLTSSAPKASKSRIIMDFPSLPISKPKKRRHTATPSPILDKPKLYTSVILDDFVYFSVLPTELRLRIWRFASFLPRDLDVWVKDLANVVGRGILLDWYSFHSVHAVPPILHASHEARAQGLKHYRLTFDIEFLKEPLSISAPPRIYLNPYSDRVCFLGPMVGNSEEEICKLIVSYKLRHLAINVEGDDSTIRLLKRRCEKAWLNGKIESITLYQLNRRIYPRQKFTFIELDKEAIQSSMVLGVIRKEVTQHGRQSPKLLMRTAKNNLWFTRRCNLNMLKARPKDKTLKKMWAGAGDLAIDFALIHID